MTIEQVIADTIRENLDEIVKNAVHEATRDIRVRLDAIEEKVKGIESKLQGFDNFATERDVHEAVAAIDSGLAEVREIVQREELERGRFELREARLLGRVAS